MSNGFDFTRYDAVIAESDALLQGAIKSADMLLAVRDHLSGRPYDPIAEANKVFTDCDERETVEALRT